MRLFSRLVVCLLAFSAIAAEDPTYTALRAARPDGRTIALNDFTFNRDVYSLKLNGTLHLLAPVDKQTFGAVFIGQGSYELTPVLPYELRQLQIQTGDDKLATLTDTFETAVFFAADLVSAAENSGAEVVTGTPNARAKDVFDDYLKRQRRDFKTNVHIRLAQERMNARLEPLFFAALDGKKYPPAILGVDPMGMNALLLQGFNAAGEQTVMFVNDQEKGGIWYSSPLRRQLQSGQIVQAGALADAEHYEIETTINSNLEVAGKATVHFIAGNEVRVLPLSLMGKLTVSEAVFTEAENVSWAPVAVIQEKSEEDSNLAVVFPAKLKRGGKYMLRLSYRGKDVLNDAGDGNFTVGARTSWYPNIGAFDDLATYDLTYRNPQKFQVISVGNEADTSVDGDWKVARWKAENPIRVAGFNYGKFRKLANADTDSGMTIEVHTNPGEPDIIKTINKNMEVAARQNDETIQSVRVNAASLGQAALADGINTARTGNYFFGPLPDKRVAITQQSQWSFGQSWPSLIYMPFISFMSSTTRATLGMTQAQDFIDAVGPHEFAHQWWGHYIGWNSYRDQWLSEGFAEFTAGLVLQQTGGNDEYERFWERARRMILDKPRGATLANWESGPIAQGWRINSWRNPNAYSAITYRKGAYVLQMLRMTMQDPAKRNPDEAFIAMMKDFTTTYAGKNPSTMDFQRMVEKHATPSLKLTPDGKADWFFQQWVYGTAIPKYASKLDVQQVSEGKYKVSGSITQSEVPDGFAVIMPIYAHFDKAMIRAGQILLVGNETKAINFELPLKRKPTKFTINDQHDVLAR